MYWPGNLLLLKRSVFFFSSRITPMRPWHCYFPNLERLDSCGEVKVALGFAPRPRPPGDLAASLFEWNRLLIARPCAVYLQTRTVGG
jgi:hypothetical protein